MIDTVVLARMVEQTRRLRTGFAETAPKPWDATIAGAELAVQLGHLALCVARQHYIDIAAFEDQARPITGIGDELADVALAALSVTTLTGDQPSLVDGAPFRRAGGVAEDVGALLVLFVAAGQLAESAMIANGYRHQPTGAIGGDDARCLRRQQA